MRLETSCRLRNLPGGCGIVRSQSAFVSAPGPLRPPHTLGGREYVLALALIVDGMVRLAVIGCPRLALVPTDGNVRIDEKPSNGGMAIAPRGLGAWWNAVGEQTCRRLEVSASRDESTARVVQSFERHHGDRE
jgi:3'-phosphoadenosine 5'-phosphosulfate (PAPS) 3'-phosphatase